MRFPKSTSFLSASLLVVGIGCTPADEQLEGVEINLENVTYLEWEDLEGRRRYFVEADGEELTSTNRQVAYVLYRGPIDDIVVRATEAGDRRGEPVTETQVLNAEVVERLVVDWDPEVYETPYLGMRAGGWRAFLELEDRPHIIPEDPDDFELLLFGEAVDRPDAIGNSPFEITRQSVREYGPYVELPLP